MNSNIQSKLRKQEKKYEFTIWEINVYVSEKEKKSNKIIRI